MRARRGFTLVEMLVGLVVSSIVLAGVAAIFLGVQGAYQNEAQVKIAVENARASIAYLERTLELAGYGVPPELAFDFSAPGAFPKDNYQDAAADFVTDDLAFRFRDPAYLRHGQLVGGTQVQLEAGTFGAVMVAGQRLLVGCHGGRDWALVQVGSDLAAADATASVSVVQLSPGASASDPCFTQTGLSAPAILRVHERRIRISVVGDRPYLLAFDDLGDPDPALNSAWSPLARDAELFQVAYEMNRPSPLSQCCGGAYPAVDSGGNSDWVMGDAAGEGLPSPLTPAPGYRTPYDDPARYTDSPANIRAVRVSLVLRAAHGDRNKRLYARISAENSPAPGADDTFYRYLVQTTVRVPNLASRSFFLPPLRGDDVAALELNVDGG